MSGGYFDYSHQRIKDDLYTIAQDDQIQKRFPNLAFHLERLADELLTIIRDLDLNLSGDSGIENDVEFEQNAITDLQEVLK